MENRSGGDASIVFGGGRVAARLLPLRGLPAVGRPGAENVRRKRPGHFGRDHRRPKKWQTQEEANLRKGQFQKKPHPEGASYRC
jgi:hypothetical protein